MSARIAWAIYALAAIGVSGLAAWSGHGLGWPAWAFAAAAFALACLTLLAKPRLPTGVVIAAALAGLAAFLGARASESVSRARDTSEVPSYDITKDALPEGLEGFIEIRGHLNMDTHLDEYAVAAGDRPDQNKPADFEVRLLLPTAELAVPGDTPFVVARIPKSKPAMRDNGVDVVRGEVRTLRLELAAPLFGGSLPDHEIHGIVLDGSATQTSSSMWFDLGLALLAALMGMLALRGGFVAEPNEAAAAAKSS